MNEKLTWMIKIKKLLLCHLGCLWTATWPKKRSSNYNWDLKIPKIIKEGIGEKNGENRAHKYNKLI